jgi:hypothetical protein
MYNEIRVGHLPKVGDDGLIISANNHVEEWRFSKHVAQYMKKKRIQSAWFQTTDENGFRWFHGIVRYHNGIAIIDQIG